MSGKNNTGDEIGSRLVIKEDKEFKDRVLSDIDALRSIPTGRIMLRALDGSGKKINISGTDGESKAVIGPGPGHYLNSNGSKGKGSDCHIYYNSSLAFLRRYSDDCWGVWPPIASLYHELVHAYNGATGTLQPIDKNEGMLNSENLAVGLPNSGIPYDHDSNPNTPKCTGNPSLLTENGLRQELQLPARLQY